MNITKERVEEIQDIMDGCGEYGESLPYDVHADIYAILVEHAERLEAPGLFDMSHKCGCDECRRLGREYHPLASPGPTDADNKTLMRLARDLDVPFSVAKIIHDKAWREAQAEIDALQAWTRRLRAGNLDCETSYGLLASVYEKTKADLLLMKETSDLQHDVAIGLRADLDDLKKKYEGAKQLLFGEKT